MIASSLLITVTIRETPMEISRMIVSFVPMIADSKLLLAVLDSLTKLSLYLAFIYN